MSKKNKSWKVVSTEKVETPVVGVEATEAPVEVQTPEATTEKPVEVNTPKTIAGTFIRLALVGTKDRGTLAKAIMDDFKARGLTHNVKGKVIRIERVQQQISAMVKDIKDERGKKTNSWWSKYTVEETDNSFKIVAKATI